jgi:O-succinylbenzoic acid--CoA ligase
VTFRSWLEGDDAEPWVVETSGSTGRPKRVALSRAAVLAAVEANQRRLGFAGPWVLKLPETYVAGLMVRARSLAAGHEPPTDWPDGTGWCTSLVGTQLLRMLDDPADAAALARAHTVLVGGGPVDPALRRRAEAAGVRVVATYGAAETCGGVVYDGVPLDGVGVALGADNRVRLAGPTLFDGYVDDPALTAEVLVDGWFLTSDAGRLDPDGRLQVLGRLDDVVVSGGVNVPGPAVAARLREHPAVAAAEVVGVPDEEWGHRLVAFVVGPLALEEARDWVAVAHPRAWAPRQVVELEAIPLLGNGKPDRVRLQELACAG